MMVYGYVYIIVAWLCSIFCLHNIILISACDCVCEYGAFVECVYTSVFLFVCDCKSLLVAYFVNFVVCEHILSVHMREVMS